MHKRFILPVVSCSTLVTVFTVLILGFCSQVVYIHSAEARVGRPLTPGSVAGVGRRTGRRTARRTVRRHSYYHYRPAVGAALATGIVIGSIVTALPPGCPNIFVHGITYNYCGGVYYQPQYQGGNVTYVIVNSPY